MAKLTGAFTLVELLVVITIIVVLISLLTPALDRAIYQAQLVQCAAGMKTLASASNVYAFDHKRYYPRVVVNSANPSSTRTVRPGPRVILEEEDMRPLIRPYLFSINKVFNDPLLKEVDFDPDLRPGESYRAWSDYSWYVGWGFDTRGYKIMSKLDDAMEYRIASSQGETIYGFRTLVADRIHRWTSQRNIEAGHPDHNDSMSELTSTNRATAGVFAILSTWTRTGPAERMSFDLNYAQQDESVLRYNRVLYNDPDWNKDAEGLIAVPIDRGFTYPDLTTRLPPR
jgi:hypothetical protein